MNLKIVYNIIAMVDREPWLRSAWSFNLDRLGRCAFILVISACLHRIVYRASAPRSAGSRWFHYTEFSDVDRVPINDGPFSRRGRRLPTSGTMFKQDMLCIYRYLIQFRTTADEG